MFYLLVIIKIDEYRKEPRAYENKKEKAPAPERQRDPKLSENLTSYIAAYYS